MRRSPSFFGWKQVPAALALGVLLTACSTALKPPQPAASSGVAALPAAPGSELGASCVLYARAASGIDLRGDAYAWWDAAAGRFLRGQVPEPGAVLVLSRTDRLQRGHVAVVRQVLDDRDILVDHSNWVSGRIITGMQVRDVSPANDWTALRFLNPDYGVFGSVYPADGFIYQALPAPTLSQNSGDQNSGELRPQIAAQ